MFGIAGFSFFCCFCRQCLDKKEIEIIQIEIEIGIEIGIEET